MAGRQRRRRRNRDFDHGRDRLERRHDHDKRNHLREFRIDIRHDLPRQRFTAFRRSHSDKPFARQYHKRRSDRCSIRSTDHHDDLWRLDDWLVWHDIGDVLRRRRRASFRCAKSYGTHSRQYLERRRNRIDRESAFDHDDERCDRDRIFRDCREYLLPRERFSFVGRENSDGAHSFDIGCHIRHIRHRANSDWNDIDHSLHRQRFKTLRRSNSDESHSRGIRHHKRNDRDRTTWIRHGRQHDVSPRRQHLGYAFRRRRNQRRR